MNGWRFIGLGFLMAYQEGLLPSGFAWPAGLGDIAMAVTAPWFAARIATDDRFRFSKAFLVWNLLGIADFVDAVFLGTLYLRPGFASPVNTGLMQRLPFALIPCFFVPLVRWRTSRSWNSGEKDRIRTKQERSPLQNKRDRPLNVVCLLLAPKRLFT
jgi:hypothetical protein